ncbi:acyltransferase family protein [Streptomyces tubbatahanensis]|uniref:Acyltransferase family protein n=1 Tax=Streptomyces tubbatahanensis TaxID=2923272 RepID=A0ABY3XSB8_9ACTN|nr:acyltransferase family protein [Streptomyces tubbatahanensis]UNS97332.1 acyltransferase family protein [Streptomyces tubbatahanensis]
MGGGRPSAGGWGGPEPGGPGGSAPGARAGKGPVERDPFLDNAKFLLIVLVVIGHTWPMGLVEGSRTVKAAYLWIASFHMPAFILLSGYLSRGFTGRPDQVRRLLAGVLAPYLVFEVLYSAVEATVWHKPYRLTLTEPTFVCWFLAALFVWRLTAPVWRVVPWPVPVAALVSLAAGTSTLGDDLALPRVLMFLPWFVLGLHLEPAHLARLRVNGWVRWCAPAVLTAGAVAAYGLAPRTDVHWLWMSYGQADLGVATTPYLLVRLALFAVTASMTAAFLALVPRRTLWLTALGAVTLYPYLLHGLLATAAHAYGWDAPLRPLGPLGAALLTALGAAVAVLLSTAPVRWLARPLVEPPLPGVTRRPRARTHSESGPASGPATGAATGAVTALGGPGAGELEKPGGFGAGTAEEPAGPGAGAVDGPSGLGAAGEARGQGEPNEPSEPSEPRTA